MKINVGDIFIPKDKSIEHMRIRILKELGPDFYAFEYLHFSWQGNHGGWSIRNSYIKEKQRSLFE